MIILGIETSCDETAISLIEARPEANGETEIDVLSNRVLSQIELHNQYGGVFPAMAKREHSKNLLPLLKKVLEEARLSDSRFNPPADGQDSEKTGLQHHSDVLKNIRMMLEREPELLKQFLEFIPTVEKPPIDLIAITQGPGLEPCLWTGINIAKALSAVWEIPVVPVNHMEGHILVSLLKQNEECNVKRIAQNEKVNFSSDATCYTLRVTPFPALALLVSGGHTELVLMKDKLCYEIVGKTKDDAVGEAFDKVARILGLPYPGGPYISALAEMSRNNRDLTRNNAEEITLPRPMFHSDNLDFSFSGLKTAVLYLVKKLAIPLDEKIKRAIAREFEDAVTDVLIAKTKKAIERYGAKTLILGGGVVANTHIRKACAALAEEHGLTLHLPALALATDNALMIALAGYSHQDKALTEKTGLNELGADGNLQF